jgi:tetratricopeptide (TPR) repeat protein
LGDALAAARPKDPIGLEIARARVASGLFGSSKSTGVGRFQLLNRLGAGGMGVIYAAYDPQLERPVAVKLVYVAGTKGGDALAEAKALARLSHPNVVTIYDYGFADDHLYIVMELVMGQNLRRWVRRRSPREILKVYHQAGLALAAAHSVALIHRDFKPDNAIVGVDGRVRVVDFGLACAQAEPGPQGLPFESAAGTPGYMAPEQIAGGPITAAADQYGFCTALQEALLGEKHRGGSPGLPRWLQTVIDRGRASSPADRFASMTDLLRALSRDPVVIARRRIVVAALIAAAALIFAGGRATLKARDQPCDVGDARLATVWGDAGRDAALDRISRLNRYGESLRPRLQSALAEHSRRWMASYRDACRSGVARVQSQALVDRRMACLERGRSALKSVAQIVGSTSSQNIADLPLAVQALPDPEACDNLTALLADDRAPPTEVAHRVISLRSRLEEARVQIASGRSGQAQPAVTTIVDEARKLSYPPLLSEALLEQGHALLNTDQRMAAIAPLTESYSLAFQTGLLTIAVEAWARRAWSTGTSVGGEKSLWGLDVVEAVATNPSTSPFARALLYNNVGCVYLALEMRDRARAAFERASAEQQHVVGQGAAELLNIDINLGLVVDDPTRRDQIFAGAAAKSAKLLGDEHPVTLYARWERGQATVRFSKAIELLEPTCASLEAHIVVRAQQCWMEVAYLRGELNDRDGALSAVRRAAALGGPAPPPSSLVRPYLPFWQGDTGAATRAFAAALKALPPNDAEPWWDRFDRADLELGLGRALAASGRLREARTTLYASLARFADIANKGLGPNAGSRLGRARAELVHVLVRLNAPRTTISSLAGAAGAWLRQAGGREDEISEFEALAAAKRRQRRF